MVLLPNKKYNIIYADPPWHYNDKSKSHGGGAESHYPCMTVSEICDLQISYIAHENSVLLVWVTYPQLEEVFKVINAWGFQYKTCAFTWVKTNKDKTIYMGMGRYTRANAEICLLATRGKGISRIDAGIKNTQLHDRLRHSQKPDLFRNLIVRLFGDLPRIELFAREATEGWDVWGNEVSNNMTDSF
jgi:N6-adenosine-specific RNA methylase IME4